MFRSLLRFYYNLKINKAYNSNFKVNGKSPEGVFWNSYYNQTKRFEELFNFLFLITSNENISVADVGCGYGAMYEFIKKKKLSPQNKICGYRYK